MDCRDIRALMASTSGTFTLCSRVICGSRRIPGTMATRDSPILMSSIGCSSLAWGEKVLKIGDAATDHQISKLILESKAYSKHHPMLRFEALLRLSALLRQRYSMSSFKLFIWNFVTRYGSAPN